MKRLGATLLLLFFVKVVFCQYFTSGEDPARVKYNYIQSPHFNVIYPRGADAYAARLASMLEQSFRHVQLSPLFKTRNINVLVHTRNAASNGFVSWAPKRMELMALPPFEFGALAWERDLSIHEFRHVSQISSLYSGLTGLSYYILGEQGIGAMTSLVPLWFYEGDAVYAETAFTSSGRGRSSTFNLAYKTRLAEGYRLNFDQYLSGSYKTYVPNHYELGYLLTSYARIKYGRSVWDSVIRYTTRNPFLMASFSFGIKKYTDKTRNQLFKSALNYFDSTWNKSLDNSNQAANNKEYKGNYIDYSYPVVVGSKTYSFKATLDRNVMLVCLEDKLERKLKTVGSVNSKPATNGVDLYWTEYANVGRWSQEKFSVLKRYSIRQKKIIRLSDFGYYSYPALKGDSLAVINNVPSNKVEVGLYTIDFKKLSTIHLNFNQAKDLQWIGDDLAYTTLDKFDNMVVVKQSLQHSRIDTLLNFGRRNVSGVKVDGDRLYFVSDYTGKACLYSYHMPSKKLSRMYEAKYGVGGFDFNSPQQISILDYTVDGYRLKSIEGRSFTDCEAEDPNYPVASLISKMENGVNLQDSLSYISDFKVKKYNKFSHLFNFHSWAPFYFDPAAVQDLDLTIYPGITLISQNLLNTSFTSFAYGYKEGSHIVDLSYTYKGWLPVFNLRIDRYSSMPTLFSVSGFKYNRDPNEKRMKIGLSAYLPIQLSYGAWNGLIQPYADLSRYNDILLNQSTRKYEHGLEELTTSFYAAWQMRLAQQNIFPRWGINGYFKMVSAPFEKGNLGELYAYRLGFLTPGLFPNHGLMARICYQNQVVDRYYFSNAFSLPRGYNSSSFRSDYYKAVFTDYSFPIAYPDRNISWLLYIKRVRANLFADYATRNFWLYRKVGSTDRVYFNEDYASFGCDLLVDFNALRSYFPITSGLRVSYNNNQTITWNTFFSITFN